MSHHVSKQHMTLEQLGSVEKDGPPSYLVIETRNTVTFKVGQLLTVKDIENTAISYTVKAPKR